MHLGWDFAQGGNTKSRALRKMGQYWLGREYHIKVIHLI